MTTANGGGFQFKKATKKQSRLRMALIGAAGSGKTYTALAVASRIGKRVAVIDTEKGSASKYADLFTFDVLELDNFHPRTYASAITAAAEAGYDVVVVDSLSHAWVGKGGGLELHDQAVDRQKTKNTYTAWQDVTPHHNAMIEAIVQSRCHVIATMRAKTEYVQEKDERTGRTNVRKVGLAPVQRDGLEYEFDVVGDLDQDNTLVVSKSRCPALSGGVIRKPGAELAKALTEWLEGEAVEPAETAKANPAPAKTVVTPSGKAATLQEAMAANTSPRCSPQQMDAMSALADELRLSKEQRWELLKPFKAAKVADLTAAQADEVVLRLRRSLVKTLLSGAEANLADVRRRAPVVKADKADDLSADEALAALMVLRVMIQEQASVPA